MKTEKIKEKSIYIYKKDGDVIEYSSNDYTDYEYDGKCFIVIDEYRWIGIHNIDDITDIMIR